MRNKVCLLLLAYLSSWGCLAADSVSISHAWARATAPGQDIGAAYMVLQSAVDSTLIEVTSPVAGSIEIHKMSMNKGVMEMRMQKTLPLPAGQAVKLEPSGFHLMLFDLKKLLKSGSQLPLTLKIMDKSGKTHVQQVSLPIKPTGD